MDTRVSTLAVFQQASGGCVVDLSSIIDIDICPTITVNTADALVDAKPDFIIITPTELKARRIEPN
jgi:hypothetical protein